MDNAAPASVSYDGIASILQGQGLDPAVIEDGGAVFSTSGVTDTDLSFALAASATGESPVTMRSGERTMFLKAEAAEDGATSYQVAVFGSLTEVADGTIKQMAVASAFILALTAALSVYLVNRFCHRYVFDRIEWSLDHLEEGVRQLSAGNLSYRIRYDRDDEFRPIADSFDRMTAQLQASEARSAQPSGAHRVHLARPALPAYLHPRLCRGTARRHCHHAPNARALRNAHRLQGRGDGRPGVRAVHVLQA